MQAFKWLFYIYHNNENSIQCKTKEYRHMVNASEQMVIFTLEQRLKKDNGIYGGIEDKIEHQKYNILGRVTDEDIMAEMMIRSCAQLL